MGCMVKALAELQNPPGSADLRVEAAWMGLERLGISRWDIYRAVECAVLKALGRGWAEHVLGGDWRRDGSRVLELDEINQGGLGSKERGA